MGKTTFPAPGEWIDGRTGKRSRGPDTTDDPFRKPLDARVSWLNATLGQLKTQRQLITYEMRRNMELYDDRHWATFGSTKRAPWKLNGVVNFCAWIADRKSALIADAKPKVTYTTTKFEDSWQCDIMNASFEEWYEEEHIQHKIEQAAKLGIIRKVAYLKPGYDPVAREGRGNAVVKIVDGINVYLNAEATSVFDAETLIEEYTEPAGRVLEKWPHLRGRTGVYTGGEPEGDVEESESGSTGGETKIQPAQNYEHGGVLQHTPPYGAPESGSDMSREGKRCLIRECWTRPRGPKYQIELDSFDFTVAGQLATNRKFLTFEDGHEEPLQTVTLEGNVVYELPVSIVPVLQFASDHLGGLRVLEVHDTLVPALKKKKVPLYPKGRRMIVVGSVVAEDGTNPFGHGRWPYIKIAEKYSAKYYPRTSIDRAVSLQDCFNRIFSMVFDAAHLTANPIWRLPLNSDLADEEVTNAPGAIMREDPTSLKLGKREAGPNIPSYVLQYLDRIEHYIEKLSDLTDAATGGKFKGQQAAETVSMYQEAAGVGFRPSLRLIEQAIIELGVQYKGIVGQFYTEQRFAHLKRQAGVEQNIPYIGVHLTADMRMQAKAGSMLPTSPSARLNYVMNLMSTPAMDVPELLRNLEEVGIIDSASALMKRLTKERANPSLQWLVPGAQQQNGSKKKPKANAGRSARGTTPGKAAGRMTA